MKVSNTRGHDPNLVSIDYWRRRYSDAKMRVTGIGVNKAMATVDSYYDSIDGVNEYITVNRGKASIEKTQRAVQALETFLEANPPARHLKKIELP